MAAGLRPAYRARMVCVSARAPGATVTVTFTGSGGQSFLDAIAIYPDTSVASNGHLYCLDVNEQPVVDPQLTHLRQVPLRTRVKARHSGQGSPS